MDKAPITPQDIARVVRESRLSGVRSWSVFCEQEGLPAEYLAGWMEQFCAEFAAIDASATTFAIGYLVAKQCR